MSAGKALAIAQICLSLGACIGYAFAGDLRKAVYWAAAAIIVATVTF